MDYNDAMKIALREAEKALKNGEISVGAVILKDGEIIASAHNEREKSKRISGHAEILALEKASFALGRWQLDDCQMVVTLEPCPMCAGAIAQARIGTLVYGADDKQYGAFSNRIDPFTTGVYPSPLIYRGVDSEASSSLIKECFAKKRK